MRRRDCLGLLLGAPLVARAQSLEIAPLSVPPRFARPPLDSDEGGLWGLMDREERGLRRHPQIVRDGALVDYIQGVACRLLPPHCPDLRIYVLRTPVFNATMAPNGMMQVWTGLLLRVDNEAQLAAVIGHEIAHYLRRHSIDRLRDVRSKSALGQFMGLLGLPGLVGQAALGASIQAYGRDHEREADRIGAQLMHQAGYDVGEAAHIWRNLESETQADDTATPRGFSLFDSHPPMPERQHSLAALADTLPGGRKDTERLQQVVEPFMETWLADEVKRDRPGASLALFSRLLSRDRLRTRVLISRAEVYKRRGGEGDEALAYADITQAAAAGDAPPAAFRGLGQMARRRGDRATAAQAFQRYLELAPEAPDAPLVRDYLAAAQ